MVNLRLLKLIGGGGLVLLLIPLLIHHYLTIVGSDTTPRSALDDPDGAASFIIQLPDLDRVEGADLRYRIEELHRIKQSVALELHQLEARRRQIQLDITAYTKRLEEAKAEAAHKRGELDRLQISLEQAKVAEREASERSTPRLGRPKALGALRYREFLSAPPEGLGAGAGACGMETCFDFSLCPVGNPFAVFIYPLEESGTLAAPENGSLALSVARALRQNALATQNPYKACVFVVVFDSCTPPSLKTLQQLLHWNGDGRNHLLWLTCPCAATQGASGAIFGALGRALVVHSTATPEFRFGFDLLASHIHSAGLERLNGSPDLLQLPPITPAHRKYLASYLGAPTEPGVQAELLKMQQEDPVSFVFQFSCAPTSGEGGAKDEDSAPGGAADRKLSDLCNNDLLRTRLLIDSTFSVILLPPGASTPDRLQLRLFEALKFGAIPVILGGSSPSSLQTHLPYFEVIDWHTAALVLPWARAPELHYFLKYITDTDVLQLRRQGRLFFERYFSSVSAIVDTVLATLRGRIGLPPPPYVDIVWPSVFNTSFTPLRLEALTLDPEDEENLGPIEPPYPSATFCRNYSTSSLGVYGAWNGAPASGVNPFRLPPHSPWDGAGSTPSEAKFRGSGLGFRPIGSGAGGAGKEFSEALGGNVPKEQFTIVMLTYEREEVLLNSLARLYLLPYLNKVVVVWNGAKPPSSDLRWPDIGVPIVVLQAPCNSLNNRFIPFAAIETEAILSIDDDAHLRHDEIVFGFRVWREHRDRVVGFPGRFHAWDPAGNWRYNSNYSCELSMVLTGAAFHHKIYSYLYTYEMSALIRAKVDELMNCEDIAMNFLVSHVTGRPPVKVTSRWTFRCPGCPVTLSEDESHFKERHDCINYFSQVYGYTPLLYTQYRADSILFKTRIPHDKQKCFKYI